jgi:hypothetical protein
MYKDDVLIETIEGGPLGVFLNRNGVRGPGLAARFECQHPRCCVVADAGKVDRPYLGFELIGGRGIKLVGPDIWLAYGSGQFLLHELAVWTGDEFTPVPLSLESNAPPISSGVNSDGLRPRGTIAGATSARRN